MIFKKGMSLIITIVDSGFSQAVVDASKKAGADGATILSGRGTSKHETTSVLGVQIQPEKEMVMILVRKSFRKDIMKEIVRACDLSSEGRGMTFCLPVDEVATVSHVFKKGTFKKIEDEKPLKDDETCPAKPKEQTKQDEVPDKKPQEKPLKEQKVEVSEDTKKEEKPPAKLELKNTETLEKPEGKKEKPEVKEKEVLKKEIKQEKPKVKEKEPLKTTEKKPKQEKAKAVRKPTTKKVSKKSEQETKKPTTKKVVKTKKA